MVDKLKALVLIILVGMHPGRFFLIAVDARPAHPPLAVNSSTT
jgi:hypothetical protein